jgi:hypothetical protein
MSIIGDNANRLTADQFKDTLDAIKALGHTELAEQVSSIYANGVVVNTVIAELEARLAQVEGVLAEMVLSIVAARGAARPETFRNAEPDPAVDVVAPGQYL